jgi:hypothetical protein
MERQATKFAPVLFVGTIVTDVAKTTAIVTGIVVIVFVVIFTLAFRLMLTLLSTFVSFNVSFRACLFSSSSIHFLSLSLSHRLIYFRS